MVQSVRRRWAGRHLVVILAAMAVALPVAAVVPASAAPGDDPITGVVFRDLDADGVFDANERGEDGIEVTATDGAGGSVSATTSGGGEYSLDLTGLGSGPFTVQVGELPAHLTTGPRGPDAQPHTTFVTAGAVADFGVMNPAHFCGDNPRLATTCFIGGRPEERVGATAVVAFPYRSGTTRTTAAGNDGVASPAYDALAGMGEVGPVRGVAHHRASDTLFVAAYAKRHAGYVDGPDDGAPDRIHLIAADGTTRVFYEAEAGSDTHQYDQLLDDEVFWDSVGRTAWGDIDVDEADARLYAVNLFDRTVHVVPLEGEGAAVPTAGSATAIDPGPAARTDCGNDDWVPGGLGMFDGVVYVTVTCTAATSQDRSELRGLVYAVGADGSSLERVASFPLDYDREGVVGRAPAEFHPWISTQQLFPPGAQLNPAGQAYYPQPWLTDVDVADDGSLLVGIADRAGDQFGNDQQGAVVNNYEGVPAGDTIRLVAQGDGTWNGDAGDEFFDGEQFPAGGTPTHAEISLGSIAVLPGSGEVVTNAYDPAPSDVAGTTGANGDSSQPTGTGGLIWLSTDDGGRTRQYQLYAVDEPRAFGKAAGVGDVELLCEQAPIQIGNRVWLDTDGDGIQDPGEAPIAGVTVRLLDEDGNELATTVTDERGEWYFGPDDGVVPNTKFNVRFDNAADRDADGPLAGLTLTGTDQGAADELDSDASLADGFPQIMVMTGGAGQNDHSFDVGFVAGEPPAETYSLGNQVWFDDDDDGAIDPDEAPAPGVTVNLLSEDGSTVLASTTTDDDGLYLFTGLDAGKYVVEIPDSNFGDGAPLSNLRSSIPTSADVNDDVDNVDDGAPVPGGEGAVRSTVVMLGDGEPEGEDPDNDADTPDANENLTVDFGFAPCLMSLGNEIWIDVDDDGTRDPDEEPVPGVVVNLIDPETGEVLDTTTTDDDGLYLFDELGCGKYVVEVDASNFEDGGPLEGHRSSTPTSEDVNDDVDGVDDGAPHEGGGVRSTEICLEGDEPQGETPDNDDTTPDTDENLTVDFGFVPPLAGIGDYVWFDDDNDGVQDDDEVGVRDVTVNLLDPDGEVLDTTTTDEDGRYQFVGLQPGDYAIEFVLDTLPDDFEVTIQDADGDDATDANDSDGDPTTGRTIVTTLDPGEFDPTWDLGIFGGEAGTLAEEAVVTTTSPGIGFQTTTTASGGSSQQGDSPAVANTGARNDTVLMVLFGLLLATLGALALVGTGLHQHLRPQRLPVRAPRHH